MRIAYITRSSFGLLGGASSYHVPAQVARSQAVVVLCPTARDGREEVVYRSTEIPVREVPWETGPDLVARLFGELRAFDPDIVHVFHSRYCLRMLRSLRGLFPRTRWIIDFRSPPVRAGRFSRHTLGIMLRHGLSQLYADHIFTHSLLTLRDNVPLRLRPVTEVPPGVDLAAIPRGTQDASAPPRSFVYVGSVSRVRRLEILVDGFAEFARQDGRGTRLRIIGGGDALVGLRARVRRLGLDEIVEVSGLLPQDELYRCIGDHDAGIAWVPGGGFARAPSLKLLEYSAAGLPFIASDTPGHRDYARRFGFRFGTFRNTADGLAQGLRDLCGNPVRGAETGDNLDAVRRFNWKYIVEHDVLPVYERLCAVRRLPTAEMTP